MQRFKRVLPFAVSILLLGALAAYAPWSEVGDILADLDLGTIIILVILSVVYYGLKTVRFWYLLEAIGIKKPLKLVTLSYMSAQPFTLLPAGEVFRSHSLEKYAGVPVKKSLPQFLMQGLLEGAAMATLSVVSALALDTLRLPMLGAAAAVLIAALAIKRGQVASLVRLVNRLPFVHASEGSIERFSRRHERVLSIQWLPRLYSLSLLIEGVGAGIAFTAVVGLGGDINGYQAILVYAIPIILGWLSLLPGGFGVSEQSAVGVLLLSDVKVSTAVAATLIMRVTIVGLGALYGALAIMMGRSVKKPGPIRKFIHKFTT